MHHLIYPDFFKKMRRGPQIITIKDMAIISAMTGVCSGFRIVDAGSGSGFLAAYLGNLVKPEGSVISYEIRKEHAEIALKNILKAGLGKFVTIKNKDIFEGIDEKDLDLITLDMPETFKAVKIAFDALKPGGWVVSYVPSIEQMREFVLECKKSGFENIESFENIMRAIEVKSLGTHPQNKGVFHTGYISFARKKG
ncbi:MAG: methyltransferase domain-containing protein [Candidatus Aenigmarchaeota archaeon]|nr:methyltransferase domain-containing protein [Candidatus Aenigmarchaeota archaeon]